MVRDSIAAPVRLAQQAEKLDPARLAFRQDVWSGLTQDHKSIPPKYFYDQRGSELFEAITRTLEYYPTREELAILTVGTSEQPDDAAQGAQPALHEGATPPVGLLHEPAPPG